VPASQLELYASLIWPNHKCPIVRGQTDKHQGRQARIHDTAGRPEPTQNDAFSLKTEQKRTTAIKNYSYTRQVNSFFLL